MRALVTHFYPRYTQQDEMFDLTLDYNRKAVEPRGWRVFADKVRRVPDRNIWREKSAIICEALTSLKDGDEVLWLDGDCLIVGELCGEIFTDIANYDFGMVKLWTRWNSGVVPMIVSPQVRELWLEMRDHEHRVTNPYLQELADQNTEELLLDAGVRTEQMEQMRIKAGLPRQCQMTQEPTRTGLEMAAQTWDAHECETCPWPPDQRGPLCGSHKVRLKEIDHRWNERPDLTSDRTQIIGFHRMNGFRKLNAIREALNKWPR